MLLTALRRHFLLFSLLMSANSLWAADAVNAALPIKKEIDPICRLGSNNISIDYKHLAFIYDEYQVAVDDERCGISLRYRVTIYRYPGWAKNELVDNRDIISLGKMPLVQPDKNRKLFYSQTEAGKAIFIGQHDNVYLNISYALKNPSFERPFVHLLKQKIDTLYSLTLEQSGF